MWSRVLELKPNRRYIKPIKFAILYHEYGTCSAACFPWPLPSSNPDLSPLCRSPQSSFMAVSCCVTHLPGARATTPSSGSSSDTTAAVPPCLVPDSAGYPVFVTCWTTGILADGQQSTVLHVHVMAKSSDLLHQRVPSHQISWQERSSGSGSDCPSTPSPPRLHCCPTAYGSWSTSPPFTRSLCLNFNSCWSER